MKYFMLILSALLCNCSPYLPASTNDRLYETALIVLECKNDKPIESSALLALRTYRFNDLEKKNDGTTIFIKVRYQELSDYQAAQIKEKLDMIPGIWDVQIIRDGVPAKDTPQLMHDFK